MKKKWMSLLLALMLLLSSFSVAGAENLQGKSGLQVTFNGSSMKSNFKTSDFTSTAVEMLPGDSVTYTLSMKNDADYTSAWYMSNSVRKSLEDKSGANGGAYSYFLSFTDQDGEETVLYNSDSVGGDGEEGLREAADNLGGDELDNYFYLGNLDANSTGTMTIRIALDGETQGNDYQKDLADLRMKFAAMRADGSESNDSDDDDDDNDNNGHSGTHHNGGSGRSTRAVKTGDETDLIPYYIAAGISGLFLLLLFFLRRKKEDEEEEAAK